MGGIIAAIGTLEILERQTLETKNAAEAAREGAIAANKNIEIFISKERARIQIEPGMLSIYPPLHPTPIDGVRVKIRCYGTTPATILEDRVWGQVSDLEKPHRGESYAPMFMPSVLIPNPEGIELDTHLAIPENFLLERRNISDEGWQGKIVRAFLRTD